MCEKGHMLFMYPAVSCVPGFAIADCVLFGQTDPSNIHHTMMSYEEVTS